jgi:hypothetical protein
MPPKKKVKNEPSKSAAPAQTAAKQTPNWPAFSPLIRESDLSLNELLPNQIVTIPNFWTAKLCKDYVSFLSSLPLTTTPGKPKKGDAVRVNDRFQIDDAAFAERLWSGTALRNLVTGANEEGGLGLNDAQRQALWGGQVVIIVLDRYQSIVQDVLNISRLASIRTFVSTGTPRASSLTNTVRTGPIGVAALS